MNERKKEKMTMKKKLLTTLSVVLILGLAALGILAYLTDKDYDTNTMTLGNVDIEQHEDFKDLADLYPGTEVKKETFESTVFGSLKVDGDYIYTVALISNNTSDYAKIVVMKLDSNLKKVKEKEITNLVIEIKTQIEDIREQIQNVE